MNRPHLFLKKIRNQLRQRYDLHIGDNADLSTILTMASEKLIANERLVIVVECIRRS